MKRTRMALVAVVAAVGLAACGGGGGDDGAVETSSTTSGTGPNFGAAVTVTMENLQFVPKEVTVKAGDEVLWRFEKAVAHNVVADTFESETKTEGEFRHTFDKPGDYPYRCTIHPGMDGVVKVEKG